MATFLCFFQNRENWKVSKIIFQFSENVFSSFFLKICGTLVCILCIDFKSCWSVNIIWLKVSLVMVAAAPLAVYIQMLHTLDIYQNDYWLFSLLFIEVNFNWSNASLFFLIFISDQRVARYLVLQLRLGIYRSGRHPGAYSWWKTDGNFFENAYFILQQQSVKRRRSWKWPTYA